MEDPIDQKNIETANIKKTNIGYLDANFIADRTARLCEE